MAALYISASVGKKKKKKIGKHLVAIQFIIQPKSSFEKDAAIKNYTGHRV